MKCETREEETMLVETHDAIVNQLVAMAFLAGKIYAANIFREKLIEWEIVEE